MNECIEHLDYCGATCPDCELPVDQYGNTEDQFDHCAFPDCGCDGARLCMAKNGASERACVGNVEGMWTGRTKNQRDAVFRIVGEIQKGEA